MANKPETTTARRTGLPIGELDTLQEMIARLGEHGERPALITFRREGPVQWTYAELSAEVDAAARGLAARGVEPGDRVALLAEDSPRWIIGFLATLRRGAVVMPVDSQMDERNLAHVLEDGDPRLVLTSRALAERVEGLEGDTPDLLLLDADDEDDGERGWAALTGDGGGEIEGRRGRDEAAALFYTSGTTGAPKGVPLNSENLLYQLDALAAAGIVGAEDRVLLPLPLHHVYPVVMGLLAPMAFGLPVVLPKALTGPQVLTALREGHATVVIGVPRLYQSLVDNIERQARGGGRLAYGAYRLAVRVSAAVLRVTGARVGRRLLSRVHREMGPELRLLASGGSPLDPELARRLEALGWRVGVGYGLTETSPLVTLNRPEEFDPDSVGKPIPGTEVRVDRNAGREDDEEAEGEPQAPDPTAEPGVEGEIIARGPGVFAGYRQLPEKTDEALVDGWYRTGDLGRFDAEGRLQVRGRRSTLLVTPGGENVQPDQVEEAYAASPVVREVGVLQSDGDLVALVVPDPKALREHADDPRAPVGEAIREASGKLPSYQRLAGFEITREALPRTRLGKIRRQELAERFQAAREQEGDDAAARREPLPVAEMSGSDRALLDDPAARRVWEWLAERYPDRGLTPDTSPEVDLGIDSMAWVDLTMEISERVGIELDEDAIAGVETVRDLLEAVAAASGEESGAGGGADLGADPEARLSERQRRWLDPLGPAATAVARLLHLVDRALVRGLFRVRVEGLSRLPADDATVVFAPNHVSFMDPFVMAAVLPWSRLRNTHWAGWVGVAFSNPLERWFSRVTRTLPVDPQQGMLSSLAFAAAALGRERSLVWFPEGQRSPDGTLQPLKPGLGIVLESRPATVVPVYLLGTNQALPPGSRRPRLLRRITVRFGAPVEVSTLDAEGEAEERRERLMDGLRGRLEALAGAPSGDGGDGGGAPGNEHSGPEDRGRKDQQDDGR